MVKTCISWYESEDETRHLLIPVITRSNVSSDKAKRKSSDARFVSPDNRYWLPNERNRVDKFSEMSWWFTNYLVRISGKGGSYIRNWGYIC